MSASKASAAIAALFLMAQPCLAADSAHNYGAQETRSAAFAGLHVRMPLGQKQRAKPTARLQLSSAYYTRDQAGAAFTIQPGSGVELGAGKGGSAALFIGGRDTAEMKEELNIGGGSTTTLVVVGGVVLVVLLLAAVASAMPTAGPRKGAFD
jgi:hypothetical protein